MTETNDPSMIVKYWGVRGSIPTPLTDEEIREKQKELIKKAVADTGLNFIRHGNQQNDNAIDEFLNQLPRSITGTYGGDTTCVEVQARDSPLVIFDAGSGIRRLGAHLFFNYIMKNMAPENIDDINLNPLNKEGNSKKDIHMFLSHFHWDHIQGLPFFVPAFLPKYLGINLRFYGREDADNQMSEALKGQQQDPVFPINWHDLPCERGYKDLPRMDPQEVIIDEDCNLKINYTEVNHPEGAFAYSVEINRKKFVFATDNEPGAVLDQKLVKLAEGADELYVDTQYSEKEYPSKLGWGHGRPKDAVDLALAAGVKTLIGGHHEPMKNDFQLDEMHEEAVKYKNEQLKLPEHEGKKLEIIWAHQGLERRL